MASRRITVQMVGKEEDNGDVRFEDFIDQLTAVRDALLEVDRAISEEQANTVYFRVVDLKHSSPAAVVLEAVPIVKDNDNSEAVVQSFLGAIVQIQESVEAPKGLGYYPLQALKKVGVPLGSRKLTGVTISSNGTSIPLSSTLVEKVETVLGPDEIEYGSVSGTLEKLNLHSRRKVFYIYPTIGKGVTRCHFPQKLRSQVLAAVGKYITVYGRLKSKQVDNIPYELRVEEIEIHPPEETLPSLNELRGIAPDALAGKSTEEFIWEIRDAW